MKKTVTFILSIIAPALSLTSCVIETDGSNPSYNPSAFAPADAYGGDMQVLYNEGYTSGKADAERGKSPNSARYTSGYDFAGKVKFSEGYNNAFRNYTPHNVHPGHPQGYGAVTAKVGQGQVSVLQGGQLVSTLRTASPNVEAHHFMSGQQQMVVKSRGDHGPATVELFDTRTGALRGKVLAYAIENGQPAWARGMQD